MTMLDNKERVSHICMKPSAVVKCKIGQDWYSCNFEVHFIPKRFYPDYMEVASYVGKHIDGQELNIEEAAKMLYDYLATLEPESLSVTNHVRGCKTHFDVDVTIK